MHPHLMRKYLDILNEQYEPPGGWPKDAPQFVKDLDTAYRTGEGPGAEAMSGLSRDQQAMMLRNQGAWVNRDPQVQKGENPGAKVYNPSQQDIDAREAGVQASLDRAMARGGQAEYDKTLKSIQSRDINKPFFTTAEPPKTDTKAQSKDVIQKQPAPTPAAAPEKIEPYAAPVDFNQQTGTMPVADTDLGKLSGGVSLGGGASNYLNPQLRAELANQSGGKFYADVAQSGQQLGYQQKLGDKGTGELAYRQTPGGGSSIGIGGSYDVTPNLKVTGGVSKTTSGQGGDRADIGLKYTFPESTKNLKRK